MSDISLFDGKAELLADGIDKTSSLMDDLASDLDRLVKTYLERVKEMSYLTIGMNGVNTEHPNASDYTPEVLRSRMIGYLNVLASISKPIRHDASMYETLIHDALKALEGTAHWDRAFLAYKRNLANLADKG